MTQNKKLQVGSKRMNWRAGPVMHLTAAIMLAMIAALQPTPRAQQLHLTNPLSIDRGDEIVEIPLSGGIRWAFDRRRTEEAPARAARTLSAFASSSKTPEVPR